MIVLATLGTFFKLYFDQQRYSVMSQSILLEDLICRTGFLPPAPSLAGGGSHAFGGAVLIKLEVLAGARCVPAWRHVSLGLSLHCWDRRSTDNCQCLRRAFECRGGTTGVLCVIHVVCFGLYNAKLIAGYVGLWAGYEILSDIFNFCPFWGKFPHNPLFQSHVLATKIEWLLLQ